MKKQYDYIIFFLFWYRSWVDRKKNFFSRMNNMHRAVINEREKKSERARARF